MKRINKLDDFVEIASTLLADLEKGLDDKWSEGMAYYDFFKFLSKRVSRFTCRYAEDTFE